MQYGDVPAGNDVMQVAAGLVHALAVRSDGTVWAWGLTSRASWATARTTDRSKPVQVAGLTGITQVAAGVFSLALRSDGTVWAWGANQNGQLGRRTVTDHEVTPARVAVLNRVTQIAAGPTSPWRCARTASCSPGATASWASSATAARPTARSRSRSRAWPG